MSLISRLFWPTVPSYDSLMAEVERMSKEFSFDAVEKELKKASKSLHKQFKELSKRIRNLRDKYVVEVAYDRDADQRLSFAVNDGVLTIKVISTVDGSTRTNETTVTLPENVLVDTMSQKYLKDDKKMVFTFKKNVPEEENPNEISGDTSNKFSTMFSELGNLLDSLKETARVRAEHAVEEALHVEEEETDNEVAHEPSFFDALAEEMLQTEEVEEAPREMTKEELIEAAKEMHTEGLSFRAIGRELGVSDKTVARWIRS